MNKIAFIIQGNKKIGYGHLFRCLRIANILEKKNNMLTRVLTVLTAIALLSIIIFFICYLHVLFDF